MDETTFYYKKKPRIKSGGFLKYIAMKTNTLYNEQAPRIAYANESFNSFNLFLTEVSICVSPTLKI